MLWLRYTYHYGYVPAGFWDALYVLIDRNTYVSDGIELGIYEV